MATTIGKRSEFEVSEDERAMQAAVNKRLDGVSVTLFNRPYDEVPKFFAVMSAGSRRQTIRRDMPFYDEDELVSLAKGFAKVAAAPWRRQVWTEDPDEAGADPFV